MGRRVTLERAGRRAREGRVWVLPLPSVSCIAWKRPLCETQLWLTAEQLRDSSETAQQLALTLAGLLGAIFHVDKLFLIFF